MSDKQLDFIQRRDIFQRLKQSKLEEIDSIIFQIANLEQAKSNCYKRIQENVPQISEGELTCPGCEVISMEYVKDLMTQSDRNPAYLYKCAICGYEEKYEGGRMDLQDGTRRVWDKYAFRREDGK